MSTKIVQVYWEEREEGTMKDTKTDIINKHPYKIWIQEGTGYYCTYIPQANKKRKLVRRKELAALQDLILKSMIDDPDTIYVVPEEYCKVGITIRELFREWVDFKFKRGDIKPSTYNRYERDFNSNFGVAAFDSRTVIDIEPDDIENFLIQMIHEKNLTAKRFSNCRGIITGMFKYAKKKGYTSISITQVIGDMDYPRKIFKVVHKQPDQIVFMEDEVEKLMEYFDGLSTKNVVDWGILLDYYTGLRPGELACLTWDDIENNIIHIRRIEMCYYDEWGIRHLDVVDGAKTPEGVREVIVPDEAMFIFGKIRELNPDGRFLFERDGIRKTLDSFDSRIRTICGRIGITTKSMNKLRKTYATMLIDAGVENHIVKTQMGHTDISTTMKFYYADRKSYNRKVDALNNAFHKLK